MMARSVRQSRPAQWACRHVKSNAPDTREPVQRVPDFQHPSLKLSVASSAAKIEGFTATLDGISRDIKSLEKWLQDCQVRIEVEAVYYESALQTDRPDELEFRTVPVTKITRALAWAEMPDAKTWRLKFWEYISRGFMHLEHGQRLDSPELVQSRPLIETPAAVKIGRAHV